MEYFSKNLSFLRKNTGKTQNEVAFELGLKQRSRYSNYEQGVSEPDFTILFKIAEYYNIHITALLKEDLSETGILSSHKLDRDSIKRDTMYINPDGILTNSKIPLMPSKALASFNNEVAQISEHEIDHYFSLPILKEKTDFIWQIEGDSMFPTYENNSYIACKSIDVSEFKWEKQYLITVNHAPMVKRLIPSVNKNMIVCRSDNDKYRDFEVNKKDITSIAKIVAMVRLD